MGVWKQVAEYLYLKKKEPGAPNNSFIRTMHWINRLSIFMFLVAIVILIIRWIRK